MELDIYIMTLEPISKAHLYVCLYVYPLIVARHLLGKNVTAATNTYATIQKLTGCVIFYSVSVLLKESRRPVLSRISCTFLQTYHFSL
jgi:hypothetical protein